MATGLLTPDARLRIVTDLGVVAPGALLHAYVSGTPSTPLATYSDSALTVPNANPVVASAGGLFPPIYLTKGTAYKLVLTDASGGAIWDVDPVSVPADNTLAAGTGITLATVAGVTTITATAGVASLDVNDFRLTLESGVPVSITDQLAKTTLYCTPSGRGNRMDVYDAAGLPTTLTSAQFSIALPAVANQFYSVFAYSNAGVLTLELAAWTNDTTPGTAAFSIASNGVYTKTADLTRRYLGVVRTTTVAGQTESSLAKRLLINHYHREPLPLRVTEATDSWGYNTAAYRQANGSTANQVAMVCGVPAPIDLRVFASAQNSGGGNVYVSIGEDSTTTPATGTLGQSTAAGNAAAYAMATAQLVKYPAPGYHYYAWLERNSGGTATWFGDNGDATLTQSGLHGTVWG